MKIITGGQTGADQAGWRAAKRFGLETGGWMPAGFLTEDGPRPEFAEMYGAKEHPSAEYPPRTAANVKEAGYLVWFGDPRSPGGRLTLRLAVECCIPFTVVGPGPSWAPDAVAAMINKLGGVPALMFAGNRESKAPGVGRLAEEHLCDVFRLLGYTELET